MGPNGKEGLSRRGFLGLTAAGVVLTPLVIHGLKNGMFGNDGQAAMAWGPEQRNPYPPEMVEGVEVYGLNENIDTKEKFMDLKAGFDQAFAANAENRYRFTLFREEPKNNPERRELVYGKNCRRLEIVVRRSDFENDPLGGGFVQRMKIEADLMTRIFENANPRVNMRAELARIIVVDDKFVDHPAVIDYAHDVDHSEFIGGNEAGNKFQFPPLPGEFLELWNVSADGKGEATVKWYQGQFGFDETYVLPAKDDSVVNLLDFKVSYYRIHELTHRLFGLPDLYVQSISHAQKGYLKYSSLVLAGDHFNKPDLNPFLAMLEEWYKDNGVRGRYDDPRSGEVTNQNRTEMYNMRPRNIRVNLPGASEIQINTVHINGKYNDFNTPRRLISDTPDLGITGRFFDMTPDLFSTTPYYEKTTIEDGKVISQGREVQIAPTAWIIRATVDGKERELFLPVGPLIMSYLAGEKDKANYTIHFFEEPEQISSTLLAHIVDSKHLGEYAKPYKTETVERRPHAYMRIEGTGFYMVWYEEKITRKGITIPNASGLRRPDPFATETSTP